MYDAHAPLRKPSPSGKKDPAAAPSMSSCARFTPRCIISASASTFLNSYAQKTGPRPSAARWLATSLFWMSLAMRASVEPSEVACHIAVRSCESSKTASAPTDAAA